MEDVAKRAGSNYNRQRIWQFENDGVDNPRLKSLEEVANGLGCSVFDILDEPLGRFYDAPISNPDFDKPCEHAKECCFFKCKSSDK